MRWRAARQWCQGACRAADGVTHRRLSEFLTRSRWMKHFKCSVTGPCVPRRGETGVRDGPYARCGSVAFPGWRRGTDSDMGRTGTRSRAGDAQSLALAPGVQCSGARTWRPTRRQARQTEHAWGCGRSQRGRPAGITGCRRARTATSALLSGHSGARLSSMRSTTSSSASGRAGGREEDVPAARELACPTRPSGVRPRTHHSSPRCPPPLSPPPRGRAARPLRGRSQPPAGGGRRGSPRLASLEPP